MKLVSYVKQLPSTWEIWVILYSSTDCVKRLGCLKVHLSLDPMTMSMCLEREGNNEISHATGIYIGTEKEILN